MSIDKTFEEIVKKYKAYHESGIFTTNECLEAMKEAYELGFTDYKKLIFKKIAEILADEKTSNTVTASDILYIIKDLQP